ncbi:MAG: phosphohydrolase [Caldiserica bacterium]|nr:phosphohydrolase [Caldisericota bacterium]
MKKVNHFQNLKRALQDTGIEVGVPESYRELEERSRLGILKSLEPFPKALRFFHILEQDLEVRADWDLADFIAVTKLHFNDHGEVHAKVATSSALTMLDLLVKRDVPMDFMEAEGGDLDDEHLIVMAAGLLHDIGNQVHREWHNLHSVILATPLLDRLLPEIYPDLETRTEIRGFILNAIYAHDFEVSDLTKEAALIGIGDATDMTKGRGRMAFELGNVNIHCVSALGIEEVLIAEGQEKPIEIMIQMSNSAGIFQVQETLGKKVVTSPLKDYVSVIAFTAPEELPSDERIIQRIYLERDHFRTAKT